jgi:hypothetical protein
MTFMLLSVPATLAGLKFSLHFIRHADTAGFVVLLAVTGTGTETGPKTGAAQTPRGERPAISAFLVDHDRQGLTIRRGAPAGAPHAQGLCWRLGLLSSREPHPGSLSLVSRGRTLRP